MNELAKARKQLKGNKKNITRMSAKEISDITPKKMISTSRKWVIKPSLLDPGCEILSRKENNKIHQTGFLRSAADETFLDIFYYY